MVLRLHLDLESLLAGDQKSAAQILGAQDYAKAWKVAIKARDIARKRNCFHEAVLFSTPFFGGTSKRAFLWAVVQHVANWT